MIRITEQVWYTDQTQNCQGSRQDEECPEQDSKDESALENHLSDPKDAHEYVCRDAWQHNCQPPPWIRLHHPAKESSYWGFWSVTVNRIACWSSDAFHLVSPKKVVGFKLRVYMVLQKPLFVNSRKKRLTG
jgi:hypothetical protein